MVPGSGRAVSAPLGVHVPRSVPPLPQTSTDMKKVKDLNRKLLTELSTCLVPEMPLICNWKHIADKYGVTHEKIIFLDQRERDPLLAMLQLPEFFNYTLREFKKDLTSLKRKDALKIISDFHL